MIPGRDLPASAGQRRLWLLQQLRPSDAAYHLQAGIEMEGPLDESVLTAALGDLIRRHDVLRTIFPDDRPATYQRVSPDVAFELERADVSDIAGAERDARVHAVAHEHSARPFDLPLGPPIRFLLVKRSASGYLLVVTQHHAISDGVSFGLLGAEIANLYAARLGARPEPPPARQYGDFVAREAAYLASSAAAAARDYWTAALRGLPLERFLPPRHALNLLATPTPVRAPAGLHIDLAREWLPEPAFQFFDTMLYVVPAPDRLDLELVADGQRWTAGEARALVDGVTEVVGALV